MNIWHDAPSTAFHWERFPNSQCVWHCTVNGKTVTRKAPDFNIEKTSLWRDPAKQQEADSINQSVVEPLIKIGNNIVAKDGIKVGNKLKFPEFNYYWKVRAIDERYAICTAYKHYTIIDFCENIRSTGTSWGLGHDTDENIAKSMLALNGNHPDGIEQELSNRNKVSLKIEAMK